MHVNVQTVKSRMRESKSYSKQVPQTISLYTVSIELQHFKQPLPPGEKYILKTIMSPISTFKNFFDYNCVFWCRLSSLCLLHIQADPTSFLSFVNSVLCNLCKKALCLYVQWHFVLQKRYKSFLFCRMTHKGHFHSFFLKSLAKQCIQLASDTLSFFCPAVLFVVSKLFKGDLITANGDDRSAAFLLTKTELLEWTVNQNNQLMMLRLPNLQIWVNSWVIPDSYIHVHM